MKGKGLKEDFRAPTMGPLILRHANVLSLSLSLSPFYRMYMYVQCFNNTLNATIRLPMFEQRLTNVIIFLKHVEQT